MSAVEDVEEISVLLLVLVVLGIVAYGAWKFKELFGSTASGAGAGNPDQPASQSPGVQQAVQQAVQNAGNAVGASIASGIGTAASATGSGIKGAIDGYFSTPFWNDPNSQEGAKWKAFEDNPSISTFWDYVTTN